MLDLINLKMLYDIVLLYVNEKFVLFVEEGFYYVFVFFKMNFVFVIVRNLFIRFLLGYLDKIYIVNFYYWNFIGCLILLNL